MSEITTANSNDVNTVQGQFKIIQKRISEVETESRAGEIGGTPSSIMGGGNDQANLRSRNQSIYRFIRRVKFQISSQSSIKCTILESYPGTLATNKMDSNSDTCCIGTDFIVMNMTNSSANFYSYDTSYEPM